MDNAQKLAILPMWVIDRIKEEMRLSPATWQVIIAAVEQAEVPQTLPCEVRLPPGTVIGKGVPVSTLMLAIAQRERYPVHAKSFAEQHQGEPVCWVNDQQLLLCSKSPRVDEPENPMTHNLPRNIAGSALQGEYCNTPLFRNTDTAEVVALRGAYLRAGEREHELRTELAQLRAALKFYADRDHYSTDDGLNWDSCSGEPANILWHESEPWFIEDGSIARAALAISAQRGLPDCATCNGEGAVGNILDTVPCPDCAAAPPAEPDDLTYLATWKRRAIEAESKLRTYDPQVVELGEQAMQALLADPKPSELVLTKCRLCDQLQADLTERDERIDTLIDDLDQAQYDKDAWKNHEESLWVQVFHGEGDDPFISAVRGAICMKELTLIQEDILTGAEDLLEKGPGFYVFRCYHYEAHYDNVGMTEPAHWELAFESYDRFPWADEAEAMVRAAKEAELIDIDDLFETPDCCFCCDTGHIIVDDTQPEYITTPCTECEKGKQIEATATSPGAQVAALMESRGEP